MRQLFLALEQQPHGSQGRRLLLTLLSWCAAVFAAALTLAMLELLFVALTFAPTLSSVPGALMTWAQLCLVNAGYGLVLVLPLAALDRNGLRRHLPSGAVLALTTLAALLGGILIHAVDSALTLEVPEFPRELQRLRIVAHLFALAATLLLALSLARPTKQWLQRRPGAEGVLAVGAMLLAVLLLLLAAHLGFAPVHQLAPAAACEVLALLVLALTFRRLGATRLTSSIVPLGAMLVLVSAVGAYSPGAASDHARFVLWNHSCAAGLAQGFRDLLDSDGDAVLPRWLPLGSADCQPSNPQVSPLQREVPGDGIDQDCQGGDAPPLPRELPSATLPNGCVPRSDLDVVLIAIDALRHDAVRPEIMPTLSELASQSLVFDQAYSPTAMTLTSVTSIFAGRVFADTGPGNALRDETLAPELTLAEAFQRSGYHTAAFSEFFVHPVFSRGFNELNPYWHDPAVHGVKGHLRSAAVSRGLLDLLQRPGSRRFAWVHLSDTHAHYSRDTDEQGQPASELLAYYRGAQYVDQQLSQLLATLQRGGQLEHTMLGVLADHGEELLAHGRQGHGPALFDESIRVPLILWVPGCAARHVQEPVSLSRVAPTVATLAGVDFPGLGLFDGGITPVVSEAVTGLNNSYKRAIMLGSHKLILDVTNGGRMLFDRASDPQEVDNVLSSQPQVAADLMQAYQRWLNAPGRR